MKEYERWNEPPINFGTHPTLHEEGSRILRKLAALSLPVPSWSNGPELKHIRIIHEDTDDHLKPDISHVIKDLFQAAKDGDHISTTNFVKNGPADHNPVEIVIKSLMLSGDRPDHIDIEEVTHIGALTIPLSGSGLGDVNLLPKQVENDTEVVYEQRNVTVGKNKKKSITKLLPSWASCLSPIGAITGPHTDYCGCSQLIQHIQGRKLWLCWPPTPHNLDIYLRKHHSGCDPFSTEEAIDQLQGMELLLLDRKQVCFILPGGTIHAVLTLTRGCHTGLKLCRMEDFEVANRMCKIQSNIMNHPERLDKNIFESCQKFFGELKGELEMWDELRKKSLNNGRVNEEIYQWILGSEELIKRYKL
jgi:hypothetical protein